MNNSNFFDVLGNLIVQIGKWKDSDQAKELGDSLSEIQKQIKEGKFDHLKQKEIKPSDLFKQ
jgi:hypothetical protein